MNRFVGIVAYYCVHTPPLPPGPHLIQPLTAQSGCPGVRKDTWPELLGVPARLARETIQKENPRLTNVGNVLNGSPVTQDFRCDRDFSELRLCISLANIYKQVFQPLTVLATCPVLIQPFTAQCPGLKVTWPELVGVPAKLARETIQKENSRLTIVPSVLSGSPVTADFSCNRYLFNLSRLNPVAKLDKK
ncbi:hypothetical protein KY290_006647 [Solanum tuberosum]|uniref:Uncharacterized protein n=1 Tax=Solanum tuberosum TaxID=4113 RepID=A0ABQ7WHK0_SOLTU|nr:hypothetical protein KY289_006072 [Solanum tuberosum]KAH0780220.1 hypothetical protein KY290_006647 [Solanum tuberosum]